MRFVAVLVCSLVPVVAHAQTKEESKTKKKEPPAPKIEPRAEELLKKMSSFLAGQPKLSFYADSVRELVTDDGLKIQFHSATEVSLQRPDKFRADIKSQNLDGTVFYDGKTLTVHGKNVNYYASAPAPPTVDGAIAEARDKLEIEAPMADFIVSDPFRELTKDVKEGAYLGLDLVEGTSCHQLIFRAVDIDWQLWIEDGDKPLPRKLVITSKKMKNQPQYEAKISKWNFAPELTADTFTFKPPPGATQIDFLGDKTRGTQAKKKDEKGGVK